MGKPPIDKAEELREATREANGVLKDLRAVVKEARGITPGLLADAERKLMAAVKEHSDSLTRVYEESCNRAVVKITKRFDELADLLLGKKQLKARKPSPDDLEVISKLPPYDVEAVIRHMEYVPSPTEAAKEKLDALPPALLRRDGDRVAVITRKGRFDTKEIKYTPVPKWDTKTKQHAWMYTANFLHPDPWSDEFTMGPDNMCSDGIICVHCMVRWDAHTVGRVCKGPESGAENFISELLRGSSRP